jgi:hypothetical protein
MVDITGREMNLVTPTFSARQVSLLLFLRDTSVATPGLAHN